MAPTLQEMLLSSRETFYQVVADVQALVDQQLASKSGISATGIKVAYKAVTAFAPGYYQETIAAMLPDMADQLQPFWADFNASGGADFGDYLTKRPEEVTEALLSVTDKMAEASARPAIVKAYKTVRGGAGKHIEAALPDLGALVQKYA
ncbi:MAG TPA: hypothetical protein VKV38_08825 [Trebonia sp.]|jgi:hypothetical protein|nr:hypothetical protein [Trebonia sp.]